MLTSSDISAPGYYWYFDAVDGTPVMAEVVDDPDRGLLVRFAGRKDEDRLADLTGSFTGPLYTPKNGTQSNARRIRIGIVDDHYVVIRGLKEYLEEFPDLEVVGVGMDGNQAVSLVRRQNVDVLLLDLSMPRRSGLDALPEIKRASPHTQVVILSAYPADGACEHECRQAGAQAYLDKRTEPRSIVQAIRIAAAR